MRTLTLALAAVLIVLVLPAGASAWTPDECAAWYAEHGSNHPDCQDYVPPQPPVTPPVQPPPDVQPPPVAPPDATPPPTPPADTATPPEVHSSPNIPDVTPREQPKLKPRHDIGNAVFAKSEERVQPEQLTAPAETPAETASAPTLPFTGPSIGPLVLVGLVLLLTGYAARRALRP